MKNIDRKMQKKCQVIYHTILNKGIYMSYVSPMIEIKDIEMRQFRDILIDSRVVLKSIFK